MNQPTIEPSTMTAIDLSTRLRSSRMCSISGIFASGFGSLRNLGRRDLPSSSPAPGAGLSCDTDIRLGA